MIIDEKKIVNTIIPLLLNENYYHQYLSETGELIDCRRVLEIIGSDHDAIKQQFLTAPVFDGKTFWQVENDLIWVEEGDSIQIDSKSL